MHAWNFRGEKVASFDAHPFMHAESQPPIHISHLQEYVFSLSKSPVDEKSGTALWAPSAAELTHSQPVSLSPIYAVDAFLVASSPLRRSQTSSVVCPAYLTTRRSTSYFAAPQMGECCCGALARRRIALH